MCICRRGMREGIGRYSDVASSNGFGALSGTAAICQLQRISGVGSHANLLFHLFLAHLRSHHFHRKDPAIAQQLPLVADGKTSLPQKRSRGVSFRIFSWFGYNRRRRGCMMLRGWWPLSGRGRRRSRFWLWWIHGGFWFQWQVG